MMREAIWYLYFVTACVPTLTEEGTKWECFFVNARLPASFTYGECMTKGMRTARHMQVSGYVCLTEEPSNGKLSPD